MRYAPVLVAAAVWYRILKRLGYSRRCFVVRDLCAPFEEAETFGGNVVFRELSRHDAPAFLSYRTGPKIGLFYGRLDNGHRCYAALDGERIVSAAWATTGKATIQKLRADFDVTPGDVYLYDAYTHPEYRKSGLMLGIYTMVRKDFLAIGCSRATMMFLPEAIVGRSRQTGHLGFQLHGLVHRYRFGPWVRFSSEGEAPLLTPHLPAR